jgi:excinuclease UvrABC nuclease subunit
MIPFHPYTVYALVDSSGTIRYIGCTQNVYNREQFHRFDKRKRGLVFKPLVEGISSQAEGRDTERELIQMYQPALNIQHTKRSRRLPKSPRFKALHGRLRMAGEVL